MAFFASSLFLNFLVPLITVFLSVFLKIVTRNDKFQAFRKEDFAVGLDIAATALILFITESANLAHQLVSQSAPTIISISEKLASVPWILSAFILGIWGVSTLVRWMGWQGKEKLKVFWGIVAPDLFGLLSLIFVVNWIRQ